MRAIVSFAAAMLVSTANATGFALPSGTPFDFTAFGTGLIAQANNVKFTEAMLLGMQSETDNVGTQCIETFDSTSTAVSALTRNLKDSTSYFSGHKLKGDGAGTTAGWYMSNINGVLQLSTDFMNLTNNCSFDYYLQGFGKATQSIDGFLNLGISFIFRSFVDDNSAANATFKSDNPEELGKATGQWIKAFMMVEIPSADLEKGENYE